MHIILQILSVKKCLFSTKLIKSNQKTVIIIITFFWINLFVYDEGMNLFMA